MVVLKGDDWFEFVLDDGVRSDLSIYRNRGELRMLVN